METAFTGIPRRRRQEVTLRQCNPPRCLLVIAHDSECQQRCDAPMWDGSEECHRLAGHAGPHRSAYAMATQRDWKLLGRPW